MKKILIIEDNKEYRELLKKPLEKEGYTIATAENGQEALVIVKKDSIDFILLDLLMPDMDGETFYYQLTHILKKHIPIIVLTNVSDATAFNDDIKEVLIKANTSLDEVVSKVKEHI